MRNSHDTKTDEESIENILRDILMWLGSKMYLFSNYLLVNRKNRASSAPSVISQHTPRECMFPEETSPTPMSEILECLNPEIIECLMLRSLIILSRADAQICRWADAQMCRCAGVQMRRCADVRMCRWADVQMCICAIVQKCKSTVQICR